LRGYLTPIKGSRKIRFATFDIETKNNQKHPIPYVVGLYDGSFQYFSGSDCIEQFLDATLTEKYRHWKIFGHNAGGFDFAFLADHMLGNPKYSERDWKFIPHGNGKMLQLIIPHENKKHRTVYQDSIALFPSVSHVKEKDFMSRSLDSLTEAFGAKFKKNDFTEGKAEREGWDGIKTYKYLYQLWRKNDPRWEKYLRHDCVGLWEVLDTYFHNIPVVGSTVASCAMLTWRKDCLKDNIPVCSTELNDRMKNAYYGGRTEIFRMYLPDGKYHCYDVNSLYPYVMKEFDYPTTKPLLNNMPNKYCYRDGHGLTKAIVEAPDDIYLPVLPVKHNNKLFFPKGKFTGFWDNSLLRKAEELNYYIKPLKSYEFDKSDYIFKEYVDKFFNQKKNSKKGTPQYITAKILMNSLYGKFAQREKSSRIEHCPGNKIPENIKDYFDIDHNLILTEVESKGKHFVPQIAIHVTARAQLRLYKYMEEILDKGGILSYCDTDSVFTDVKLPTSNNLGDMSLEYDFDAGYFLLPKTYYIKNNGTKKVKAKGFPWDFRDNLVEKDFINSLFYGNLEQFQYESQPRFNTLNMGYRRHNMFVSMDVKRRSIQTMYDKRRILPDLDTDPYPYKEIVL